MSKGLLEGSGLQTVKAAPDVKYRTAQLAPPVVAFVLVLSTFVVLMGATWFRHTDVGDAQLYQVIARNIVRSGNWLSLSYLPTVGTPFYDHLPFGIWSIAAAMKLGGEGAVIPLNAFFSVATVLTVGWTGHRLGGPFTGLASMLCLSTTQMYFFQTSYPTLDPLLLLLATASAVPVLTGRGRPWEWLVAWLLAAMAVAVKGPFGLLPLGGAVGARALVDRSWRYALIGGAACGLAALPVALFLYLRPDWREGYGVGQLLASALGTRTDGASGYLTAVKVIAGRYWPWFPALAGGALVAIGRPAAILAWLSRGELEPRQFQRACRLLAVSCALIALGLSLPHRKIWHHTLVAYPLLSVLAAVAFGPRLSQLFCTAKRMRYLVAGLCALLAVSVTAVVGGLERVLMYPPCVLANELKDSISAIRPGTEVLVVSPKDEWDMLSALAFERDVVPVPSQGFDHGTAAFALVRDELWPAAPGGWRPLSRARGWVLATTNAR